MGVPMLPSETDRKYSICNQNFYTNQEKESDDVKYLF